MSKQINDLNKSLEEQLHLNEKQDKTDNNLKTNDKTVVGAINELFQSANNGKQLIANAIGEPLNSNDTFSAMSNDINSLLATFKTNMISNGVTVGSNDKFKQLIDKIAIMAEENNDLRDSLADILKDKGVNVTEGDDIDSLISKVDSIHVLKGFPEWYEPPSNGVWITGPTVEYEYIEGDITSYGENLYITSGYNQTKGYVNNFYCFNIKTGVMTKKAKMPAVRYSNTIDCVGNMLYCIGGATNSSSFYSAQNTIYCYDPKTNSWTTKGTLSEARFGHTSVVVGSKIYIIAGSGGTVSQTGDGSQPDKSMIYDVSTNTCTTFTSRAKNIYSSAAVLNNKIYVFGGGFYSNASCGLYIYDLALRTWTTKYLKVYRSGSELLEYNGELYIYNGRSSDTNYAKLSKINLNDLTLTDLTEPLTGDGGGSAIVIDNKIYAFGGYANSTAAEGGYGYRNTVRVFIF